MTQPTYTDVRPSPIAGRGWYPGSPNHLAASVDAMLDDSPPMAIPGRIVALVAPHAGHIYSGPIAAKAFRLVQGLEFNRVVVVSPLHRDQYDGPLRLDASVLTTAHDAYHTPLGDIPVDREALDRLGQKVRLTPVRRDGEHSLEIELPFLQRVLDAFTLIPLMMRDQSFTMAERMGKALAELIADDSRTLLVASTDLSHFRPLAVAERLDGVVLERIEALDAEGVIRVEEEGRGFACGRAAVAVTLVAARELGADAAQIVAYGTSADATGDVGQVVGYGAAVIYQTG